MKLAIALLACVGLMVATSIHTSHDVKITDKDFLAKQKFLFEIVYRVEDPLIFEEYIKLGDKFIFDKSYYTHYDYHMEKFWESYKMGSLLPQGEFFGALVKTHHKQAWGLFNFFYYAKDWETFRHNVCWARMHVNEGMFVYALTLSVIHREDFNGLIMPSIYEIFPQYFFNSKFIFEAEKFDYDVWSKYVMYEKELFDVYHTNQKYFNHGDYVYMKDWKMWQWWKLMGLGQHWYAEDKYMLRENIDEFNQDSKWKSMMQDVKMWWMPVDYTRDIEIYNEHSSLSYFTEDVGINAFWYYLNMDSAFFLDGKTFGLNKERRGECWIYNVQQLMSRYYMERLSHGFGEIPEFFWFQEIEHGYDPQLINYNGVGFSYRQNYWEAQTFTNIDMLNKIHSTLSRIYGIIDFGYYKMMDGSVIDMRKSDSVKYIANLLQGNIDTFDKYFFSYWYMLSHMYLSEVDSHDFEQVYPNVLLNFETMMRDPMFYIFHGKIADTFFHYKNYLVPYTNEELKFQGVYIKDVQVTDLVTYFDLVDFDVTNLLNDKMHFVDGKFVWDKALMARQMRLNHKPFNFEVTIESDKAQKAVIRSFIGPKYDEFGRILSLAKNRENFFELDSFVTDLSAGKNLLKRSSNDFYWTSKDRTTYTELYHYVMMAIDGKYELGLDINEPHSGFPDRLILPRGWEKGMPMQIFFMVSPYMADHEQFANFDHTYTCSIGSGNRYVDNKPLYYPFDRVIDEYEFFVPNMFFKDVKIYHHDTFEMYLEDDYKNYGSFDYNFFNNYYTKSVKY